MDPVTLSLAAIGGSALGNIAQGQAASNSAKYNAAIASNNAQVAAQNATFAGEEGEANVSTQEIKNRTQMGAIKANQGASGVTVGTGSSANVQASEAQTGALDAMTVRSNASRQAYGYQTEQVSDINQAALDKQQAKSDSEAGYLGAANSLLSKGAAGFQSGTFSDPFASQQASTSLNPEDQFYEDASAVEGY